MSAAKHTPRTDAEALKSWPCRLSNDVTSDFARELERENTALRNALEELRDHAVRFGGVPLAAEKLWHRVDVALSQAGIPQHPQAARLALSQAKEAK